MHECLDIKCCIISRDEICFFMSYCLFSLIGVGTGSGFLQKHFHRTEQISCMQSDN